VAMVKKIATIDIVEIDAKTVEKHYSLPETYAFYIKLSGKPERQWINIFNFEWRKSRHPTKKEISVVGDRLRLTSGVDDNIQNHVAFARSLMNKTNKRVEEDNRRIEQMYGRIRGGREEVEKEKEEIRRKLKEISLE
jgi:hypothetical protein